MGRGNRAGHCHYLRRAGSQPLPLLIGKETETMSDKPEFFWSPPDGAPIVGVTTFRGFVVIATASGVYTLQDGPLATPPDTWTVQKISLAVRQGGHQ